MADDTTGLVPVDALVQLSFLVLGELGKVAAGHDLSLTQVRLLGILRDRRAPMLALARLMDLEKSSITGLVDRAEKRGLVRRSPDEADGRGVRVELTDAGRDVAGAFTVAMTERVEGLLAELAPRERAQLARLADRLVARTAPAQL